MTSLPLVSIIIPLYNHEQFIIACLDSILEDPYPLKEVVIIDDGSRDGSVATVNSWRASHPASFPQGFTLISRENRGLTKTLNELVTRARGELIAVLASDDYLLPGGIGVRVAYLEKNRHKLAVFADCILVDYEGVVSEVSGLSDLHNGRKSHLSNERLISYEIVFNWCVPGPVFMARKSAYAEVGFYNENIAVEDWDFYLRLVARNQLGFIDLPVAVYRIRPDEALPKISVLQHIRFNEAMLQTVTNNIPHFSGLKKAYLYAEKLKYQGVLARLMARRTLQAFLIRKAGRTLIFIFNLLYHIFLFFLLIFSALDRYSVKRIHSLAVRSNGK